MNKFFCIILLLVSIYSNGQNLIPYRKANIWGFSNSNGTISIQPQYDSVTLFNSNNFLKLHIAQVFISNKTGFINSSGKYIIPIYAENLFHNPIEGIGFQNIILAQVKGKYGIINFSNNLIVPFEYDTICIKAEYTESAFGPVYNKNYNFYAKKNSQYYKIRQTGETTEIKKQEYNTSTKNSFGMMLGSANVKFEDEPIEPYIASALLKNNSRIDSISLQRIGKIQKYHAVYFKNKVGIVREYELKKDSLKNWIVPEYDSLVEIIDDYNYISDMFVFMKNNKLIIINEKGDIVMEPKYDGSLYKTNNNYILIKNNNKIGCYILKTHEYIPTIYDSITYISNNLFYVNYLGRTYYINNKNFAYYTE